MIGCQNRPRYDAVMIPVTFASAIAKIIAVVLLDVQSCLGPLLDEIRCCGTNARNVHHYLVTGHHGFERHERSG